MIEKQVLIAMILICSISCNDAEIVKEPKIEKYVDIEIIGASRLISIKTFITSMVDGDIPVLVRVKIIGQKSDFFVTLKIPSNMQQELEKKGTMLVVFYPSGYVKMYLHDYKAYPFKFFSRSDDRLIKFIKGELS